MINELCVKMCEKGGLIYNMRQNFFINYGVCLYSILSRISYISLKIKKAVSNEDLISNFKIEDEKSVNAETNQKLSESNSLKVGSKRI